MEELLELRQLLQQGKVEQALSLVDELEDMSLSDKINKIDSYGVILLVHLIKQQAEKRSTRSWNISIDNAVREIKKLNKRRKTGGFYLDAAELVEILQQGYEIALKRASAEAFEGRYEAEELEEMVDWQDVLSRAIALIQQ